MKENSKLLFSEQTLKLKTKLITFSSISLFIGMTKILPHEFKLIGIELPKDDKTLGWFILVITIVLFLHFLLSALLEILDYKSKDIIGYKTKNIRSELSGLTLKEIDEMREDAIDYGDTIGDENETDSIHNQSMKIEKSFIRSLLVTKTRLTFIFEFVLPWVFSVISICFLYHFLSN
ncbi:MAG: hypothetical protein L3J43_03760 [Sulfurovum sp.]|nr:hypothetical protein [Sulfurovum sp.]